MDGKRDEDANDSENTSEPIIIEPVIIEIHAMAHSLKLIESFSLTYVLLASKMRTGKKIPICTKLAVDHGGDKLVPSLPILLLINRMCLQLLQSFSKNCQLDQCSSSSFAVVFKKNVGIDRSIFEQTLRLVEYAFVASSYASAGNSDWSSAAVTSLQKLSYGPMIVDFIAVI